jgi:hypothetical protein
MSLIDLFSPSLLFSITIVLLIAGVVYACISYVHVIIENKIELQNRKLASIVNLVSVIAKELHAVKSELEQQKEPVQLEYSSQLIDTNADLIRVSHLENVKSTDLISVSDDDVINDETIDDSDEDESENDSEGESDDEAENETHNIVYLFNNAETAPIQITCTMQTDNELEIEEIMAENKGADEEKENMDEEIKLEEKEDMNEEIKLEESKELEEKEKEELGESNVKIVNLSFPDDSASNISDMDVKNLVNIEELSFDDNTKPHNDYKKMSLNKLKEFAVHHGITAKVSMMKKHEIIKLLDELSLQ